MNRSRTGIWAVAAASLLAAIVSRKGYGTSLDSDAGTAATATATATNSQQTGAAAATTGTAATATAIATSTQETEAAVATTSTAKPPGTACPAGLPGPDLVFIPGPVPYCIDAHEVSQGEYGEFLNAVRSAPPGQPDQCKWNDRFEPIPHSFVKGENGETIDTPRADGSCPAGLFDPIGRSAEAVRCVDWCDARAYCAWAGKRLCTSIGPRPNVDQDTHARSATLTEFQYACTGAGRHPYPYGDAYIVGKCADANTVGLVAAGQGSLVCAGADPPFNKIRDLVGSVFEWTAECDATHNDCLHLGGYYTNDPGAPQSCANSGGWAYLRDTNERNGVRCCADAVIP